MVTVSTIGDEEYRDYANRLFEAWGIGKKGKDNGVLIFNTVGERKVWIEIGYGLEPIINDAKAGDIYRQLMRPLLRQGRYGEAFYNGVLRIAQIIAEAEGVTLEPHALVRPPTTTGTARAIRGRGDPLNSLLFYLFIFGSLGLFLGMGRRGRRSIFFGGPWFWGGGIGGGGFGGGFGGGGFGGGFGGFGGGASGGGGAGGGY